MSNLFIRAEELVDEIKSTFRNSVDIEIDYNTNINEERQITVWAYFTLDIDPYDAKDAIEENLEMQDDIWYYDTGVGAVEYQYEIALRN